MAVIGGRGPFATASFRRITNPFATKPAATNPYAGMSVAGVQNTTENANAMANYLPATMYRGSYGQRYGAGGQLLGESPETQAAFARQGTPLGAPDPSLPTTLPPAGKQWVKLPGSTTWTLQDLETPSSPVTHQSPIWFPGGSASPEYQQYQANVAALLATTPSAVQPASYAPKPYTARAASKPRATTSKGYGWYYS